MDTGKRSDYGEKVAGHSFEFRREDGKVVRRRGGGRPMPSTPSAEVRMWKRPTKRTSPAERE